ncbi:MAG: hypothetical protein ACR2P4_06620 [Gammaproteobacteria bacterium]
MTRRNKHPAPPYRFCQTCPFDANVLHRKRNKTMKRRLHYWNREDTILALDLYLRLSDDDIIPANDEIGKIAELLGVSAHALCVKIIQFRSLDPTKDGLNISKPHRSSKMVMEVWEEFSEDEGALRTACDIILADV